MVIYIDLKAVNIVVCVKNFKWFVSFAAVARVRVLPVKHPIVQSYFVKVCESNFFTSCWI